MAHTFFKSGTQSLNKDTLTLTRFCGPDVFPSEEALENQHCLQIIIDQSDRHTGHRSAWTSLTRPEVAALISQLARFLEGVSDSDEVVSFSNMFKNPE
jgi:hypothetical protein